MSDGSQNSSPASFGSCSGSGGDESVSKSLRQRNKDKMMNKRLSSSELNHIYGEAVSGLVALSLSSPSKSKSEYSITTRDAGDMDEGKNVGGGFEKSGKKILKRSCQKLSGSNGRSGRSNGDERSPPPEKKVTFERHVSHDEDSMMAIAGPSTSYATRQARKRKIKLYSISRSYDMVVVEEEGLPFEKKKRTSL